MRNSKNKVGQFSIRNAGIDTSISHGTGIKQNEK